jgi:hypothetical protein
MCRLPNLWLGSFNKYAATGLELTLLSDALSSHVAFQATEGRFQFELFF